MEKEIKRLQRRLEKALAKSLGKRCIVKDIDEFPELKDGNGRCITCVAYEKLDRFIVSLWRK